MHGYTVATVHVSAFLQLLHALHRGVPTTGAPGAGAPPVTLVYIF